MRALEAIDAVQELLAIEKRRAQGAYEMALDAPARELARWQRIDRTHRRVEELETAIDVLETLRQQHDKQHGGEVVKLQEVIE